MQFVIITSSFGYKFYLALILTHVWNWYFYPLTEFETSYPLTLGGLLFLNLLFAEKSAFSMKLDRPQDETVFRLFVLYFAVSVFYLLSYVVSMYL